MCICVCVYIYVWIYTYTCTCISRNQFNTINSSWPDVHVYMHMFCPFATKNETETETEIIINGT